MPEQRIIYFIERSLRNPSPNKISFPSLYSPPTNKYPLKPPTTGNTQYRIQVVAIASGNSPSNTSFHKEGKLHNNREKCEKELSSSSLEKQSIFHLKSKEDKLCTALGENKKTCRSKIYKVRQSAKESGLDNNTRWKYGLKHSHGQHEPVSRHR